MLIKRILFIIVFLQSIVFAQSNASIYGFVREKATGEPLSYVNVFLKGTDFGAPTNSEGYYSISFVPAGEYEIVVSMIGYETITKKAKVEAGKDYRYDFFMNISPVAGEKITVVAEREKFKESLTVSGFTFSMKSINSIPGFMESDVLRAIQHLPGVQSITDYTAALYVRGGTPDQNLVMIDGIPIYNPFHLGAIFSTFNTDAIKEAEFIAGGFPVEYGGRIGSVINIVQRDGNANQIKGNANVSLISSKILLEGPLKISKNITGTWMIGGRRTYFDKMFDGVNFIVEKISGEENSLKFPYYFYDFNNKINLNIGNNHRITLISFYGDDVFYFKHKDEYSYEYPEFNEYSYHKESGEFTVKWGNRANGIIWRWLLSPRLVVKNYLYNTRFRFFVDVWGRESEYYIAERDTNRSKVNYGFNTYDYISENSYNISFSYKLSPKHLVLSGCDIKWYDYNLGMEIYGKEWEDTLLYSNIYMKPLDMKYHPFEYHFYIQDKWEINPLLFCQFGLRTSKNTNQPKFYNDPRFNIKCMITENLSTKFSWGIYHQYLTTANPPDETLRLLDVWLPVARGHLPIKAIHNILGFEYLLPNNSYFRIEGYYKDYKNLLELKAEKITVEEEDEGIVFKHVNEFRNAKAYSYGLEILYKKTSGKIQGWIGYSYAVVKKKLEDGNKWFFPKYDRRHSLNIVGFIKLKNNLKLGTTLTYCSGNPYTPIIGKIKEFNIIMGGGYYRYFDLYDNELWLLGEKNSARYPYYFRLDIGIMKRKEKSWGSYEWYFHIINVTMRLNVMTYIYEEPYYEDEVIYEGKKPTVVKYPIPMFPIMPTFGVKFEF